MDMHEVVNEVSRPVTAASSRKGLGLTREYCVLPVAALGDMMLSLAVAGLSADCPV